MNYTTLSEHGCFGGVQGFYEHPSAACGGPMRFGVFRPPQALSRNATRPVLFFLAGLTCNEETFAIKAGAQQIAARLGLILVTPDTSPRATGIEGADAAWDFGHGAGFWLDATEAPWAGRFGMETWVTQELRDLVTARFSGDEHRVGLAGHSMGGHGALTLALRHAGRYASVSALAPIAAPTRCPWGEKAFSGYLGPDRQAWAAHDACALIEGGARCAPLLVDQGLSDKFLHEQLKPEALEVACAAAGQPLRLRRHPGYDHGYFFIASMIGDHLAHHARYLGLDAGG